MWREIAKEREEWRSIAEKTKSDKWILLPIEEDEEDEEEELALISSLNDNNISYLIVKYLM